MKVGLFANASEELPIEPLLRSLSDNGINASLYRVRESWRGMSIAHIRANLGEVSHLVLWARDRMPPQTWSSLLAGYAIGTSKGLYVLAPAEVELEEYLEGFRRLETPERLAEELIGARSEYEHARLIDKAREELISSGFALTEATLLEAVGQGNERAARNFLILGYSPNARDESGLPALFRAVRSGSLNVVRLLVDYGADVNEQSGDRGTSPLMEAAGTGQVAVTRQLLEAGADPDMVSTYGQSAAILAASEGHADTLKLLLEWNARTDLVDHLGMTALKYATLFHHDEAAQALEVDYAGGGQYGYPR
ncbi:MAG: ankyrin repeat domain-containing protein [Spirochaetaceae bacterium]